MFPWHFLWGPAWLIRTKSWPILHKTDSTAQMSPLSNSKKIWKTSTENCGKAILWEGNFLIISKGELKCNVLMLMDLMGETGESRPWTWSRNSLKKEVLNNCSHYCFIPLLGVFCDSSYFSVQPRFIDQIIKQVSVGIILYKCVLK